MNDKEILGQLRAFLYREVRDALPGLPSQASLESVRDMPRAETIAFISCLGGWIVGRGMEEGPPPFLSESHSTIELVTVWCLRYEGLGAFVDQLLGVRQ